MTTRIILTLIGAYYIDIIKTSPNTGNEMGNKKGDKKYHSGNSHINFYQHIIHLTMLLFLRIYHIVYHLHDPVTMFDWSLFIVATFGIILRLLAYRELKSLFTYEIGIRNKHKLIKSGPYRYLSHPGYTGQYLTMISSILFFRLNPLILIPIIIFIHMQFMLRIKAEEKMLTDHFKGEYKEFLSSRWKLIPFIF